MPAPPPAQPPPGRGASAFRSAVERRSAPVLVMLHQGPRWVFPVLMAALLLVGIAAPPWLGAAALSLLAACLAWLGYLSWPLLRAPGRVLRVVALGTLVVAVVARLGGTF